MQWGGAEWSWMLIIDGGCVTLALAPVIASWLFCLRHFVPVLWYLSFCWPFGSTVSASCAKGTRKERSYGLFCGEGWAEAALLLIYVLITVYKYIYVYRNSHNLYFHWRVQYVTGFDSCVLKTVCRYLLGLCIVWSWDLMGQFAQWGLVCVCVCPEVYSVCI